MDCGKARKKTIGFLIGTRNLKTLLNLFEKIKHIKLKK